MSPTRVLAYVRNTLNSRAKILPAYVVHESNPRKYMKSSVIKDDQSNKILATGDLLDFFDVCSLAEEYITS